MPKNLSFYMLLTYVRPTVRISKPPIKHFRFGLVAGSPLHKAGVVEKMSPNLCPQDCALRRYCTSCTSLRIVSVAPCQRHSDTSRQADGSSSSSSRRRKTRQGCNQIISESPQPCKERIQQNAHFQKLHLRPSTSLFLQCFSQSGWAPETVFFAGCVSRRLDGRKQRF